MSFSFGFSGDDIEDEETEQPDGLAKDLSKTTISEPEQPETHIMRPKRHSLEELVSRLAIRSQREQPLSQPCSFLSPNT
jgi:hypothetical protein